MSIIDLLNEAAGNGTLTPDAIGIGQSPQAGGAAYQPFPVAALPDVLRRMVTEGAAALGCDPAYIALPLLAVVASAIGNSRRLRLKGSWAEPPVLWCIVVGDSGTMKSPAYDLATAVLKDRQSRTMREYARAKAEYEDAKEQWTADIKAWRKADPASRGERPAEPQPPVCERLWVSDTTVEALADRLANAPRGLLLARDELSGWLSSFNQYKAGQGGDVAHWLEMHRAGALIVDRKTGDKTTIHIPRAAVCIAGGIQPQTLRRCLTAEFFENGLAARMLLAMPPKRRKRWTEAAVDPATMQAVGDLLAELWQFQPATDSTGEPYPADVDLTPEAKRRWIAFYDSHAAEQAELDGSLAAAWSKLEGYAARLSLVVHCVRRAAGERVEPWLCDERSIESGITLSRWFGGEARRVYGLLDETPEDRQRRELVDLIRRKGGTVSVRELSRSSRMFSRADDWEQALIDLAEAGMGRWIHPPHSGRGRPGPRLFELTVDTLTNDTNSENQGKSAIVSTVNSVNAYEGGGA